MSFHDVRFPTGIAFGAAGGPQRRTEIVTLASGFEERNALWANSRRKFNAGYGVRSKSDLHAVIEFFEARRGRLYGFRYKDHSDFRSKGPLTAVSALDQSIGTGNGVSTAFQLAKTYASGGQTWVRTIKKPVSGTVTVAVAGLVKSLGPDFSVDTTTGIVTFTAAPANGTAVTAGFEFDTPVRFDTDELDINLTTFEAGEAPSIPLVEIRL